MKTEFRLGPADKGRIARVTMAVGINSQLGGLQGREVLTVMIFFSGLIGSSSFEALRLFPSLTVSDISA
jgi:hypothetical protein